MESSPSGVSPLGARRRAPVSELSRSTEEREIDLARKCFLPEAGEARRGLVWEGEKDMEDALKDAPAEAKQTPDS